MNYRKEPYPENLEILLKEADELAVTLQIELSKNSTPKLNDLYRVVKGKTIRQKEVFEHLGYFPNEVSGKSTKDNEFKGLYIFGEEIDNKVVPVYVGISRTIFRRLRQHGWGKLHNECSLAYLFTKELNSGTSRNSVTHSELHPSKKQIRNFKVVLLAVENDYDLYFLEVALSGFLKTKWNSFRTH